MDKEVYTLIDTALKIGLGALISGAATYFVARHNSTYEKTKEDRAFKRQILQQAAIKLELVHFKLDEATHPFWAHIPRKNPSASASAQLESLKYNLDARCTLSEARALITLLGISSLRESLLEIEKDIAIIYEATAKNEIFRNIDSINNTHDRTRRRIGECIEKLGNYKLP